MMTETTTTTATHVARTGACVRDVAGYPTPTTGTRALAPVQDVTTGQLRPLDGAFGAFGAARSIDVPGTPAWSPPV